MKRGFSVIEVITIIGIMLILFGITMYSYNIVSSRRQVEVTTDSISAKLEQAKIDSISGKNGKDTGIRFNTTGYVYFSGTSFNPADATNSSSSIPTRIQITKSFSNGGNDIIFTRITGIPNATGTIRISDTVNPLSSTTITVGTFGDINVVK
jgi:Tfp pilus assembly major pilin PilA